MSEASDLIAISRYGASGASTRVRIYDWLYHLGIDFERYDYAGTADNKIGTLLRRPCRVLSAEFGLRRLLPDLREKTVLISRSASPFSSGGIEAAILQRARRSVYDFDDAIYLDGAASFQGVWSTRRAWTRSVSAADIVVAGNDVLAEEASIIRQDVRVIPSCVDVRAYLKKTDYEITGAPRGVWIGTPATEPFLSSLTQELIQLNERCGLRITVISAGSAKLGALERIIDRYTWHASTFHEQIARADFGLMPMPDTPFARAKCSYKLLQYGAAALPTVATPIGANRAAIQRMRGLSASTPREWGEAIASIVTMTTDERSTMGKEAHAAVEKHYSFDAWAAEWLAAVGISISSNAMRDRGSD